MKDMKGAKREFSDLSHQVIGCAIEVHRILGPALLESTYARCLAQELQRREIPFGAEVPLPVTYKGERLDCGYRVDLLVNRRLIVELKSVERITGIHQAQLLTYMRLARTRLGKGSCSTSRSQGSRRGS
jgi:GxxExxY protein